MIKANYYANWLTAILVTVNVIWGLGLLVNAIIQRKQLSEYVQSNWKTPLAITLVLSVCGAVTVFLPNMGMTLGLTGYIIAIFALILQSLFLFDYHKMLSRYIQDSWYLMATKINGIVAVVTAIAVLTFIITTIAVTDY